MVIDNTSYIFRALNRGNMFHINKYPQKSQKVDFSPYEKSYIKD